MSENESPKSLLFVAIFPVYFEGLPGSASRKLLAGFSLWQAFREILKVLQAARSWQVSLCGKLSGIF